MSTDDDESKLDDGLDAILKGLKPGQTLTCAAIAEACGVSVFCIKRLDRKARASFRKNYGRIMRDRQHPLKGNE